LLAASMMGSAFAQQSLQDEIQEEEAPGSEIEMDIGPGGVEIGRERNMRPSPVEIEGEPLDVPNDPDTPVSPDAIDAELPGEGPQDLSGPDDDDPLPE
jgi:hypothetical protein